MVRSEDCKSSQFGAFSVRSRNLSGFMCVRVCVEGFYSTESHTCMNRRLAHMLTIINIFALDHAVAVNQICHDMVNFDMHVCVFVCDLR